MADFQPIGQPVPANAVPVAGKKADGTLVYFSFDSGGNLNTTSGGGGGGAVTIADGADVTEGAIADVKVVGDSAGTVSAKLRGINYLINLATDTINNWLKVSIQNATLAVTQSGTWTVTAGPRVATTETLSNVSASASNVTLLAANASRLGAIFFNDSTSAVYVKFGATASTSSFTYKVFAYQTLELTDPLYRGIVDGIWDSATGAMRVTEAT